MTRLTPLVLALFFVPGCGETTQTKKPRMPIRNSITTKLDDEPTILGVGPETRVQLRKFLTDSGIGDADNGIKRIMDEMKKKAERLGIQADADGNYVYPDDLKQTVAEMKAKGGVGKVMSEFGLKPPMWAEKAINRSQAGKSTPDEEELLMQILLPTILAAGTS